MFARKRFTTHEIVPQRIQTRDSAKAHDWINAEYLPRQRGMLGLAWQGDLKPVADTIDNAVTNLVNALHQVKDKSKQRDALTATAVALANNFGAQDDETVSGDPWTPTDVQRMNDKRYEPGRSSVRDMCHARMSNAEINAMNREFHRTKG
jgi:hypothetical protein